jgi:hypothetical protein
MSEVKRSSNAVAKIRVLFKSNSQPLTLKDIKDNIPDLKSSEISMALCYFLRQRYVTRQKIENPSPKERKQVWQYTYSDSKLAEVNNGN